jgi:hypothetical protein
MALCYELEKNEKIIDVTEERCWVEVRGTKCKDDPRNGKFE